MHGLTTAAIGFRCTSHASVDNSSTIVRCGHPRNHNGDHVCMRGPWRDAWTDETQLRCVGVCVDPGRSDPQPCVGHYGHPGNCDLHAVMRCRPKGRDAWDYREKIAKQRGAT